MKADKLSRRARAEQDFYLAFLEERERVPVTEAHRLAFYHFDSSGGATPTQNPIVLAKARYGQWCGGVRESREEPWMQPTLRELREQYRGQPRVLRDLGLEGRL